MATVFELVRECLNNVDDVVGYWQVEGGQGGTGRLDLLGREGRRQAQPESLPGGHPVDPLH